MLFFAFLLPVAKPAGNIPVFERRLLLGKCKKSACGGVGSVLLYASFLRSLPHGVTVAQLTLDQFVKVRILVRQPIWMDCGGARNPFFARLEVPRW